MLALLDDANPTLTAVAAAAGISRKTLYNFLSDEDFLKAYQRKREAQAIARAEQLNARREQAISVVAAIMEDEAQPGMVRLKAASQILSEANTAQGCVDGISKSLTFEAQWNF